MRDKQTILCRVSWSSGAVPIDCELHSFDPAIAAGFLSDHNNYKLQYHGEGRTTNEQKYLSVINPEQLEYELDEGESFRVQMIKTVTPGGHVGAFTWCAKIMVTERSMQGRLLKIKQTITA